MAKEFYPVIRSTPVPQTDSISVDADTLLRSLYAAIGCVWVEFVQLTPVDGVPVLIAIDEEGKFTDKRVNFVASASYPGAAFGDFIVGDAVVGMQGLRNGEPDFVPLPSGMVDKVLRVLFARAGLPWMGFDY